MLTDEQADAIYEKARDALNDIIRARRGVTREQKEQAKEQRTELTLNYIGKAIADVEQRTAKFQAFVDDMQALINAFGPSAKAASIRRLKGVLDEAGTVIVVAKGEGHGNQA
jgi:hypothetical protein